MQRAVLNRATVRVADTRDLSGRVTAKSVKRGYCAKKQSDLPRSRGLTVFAPVRRPAVAAVDEPNQPSSRRGGNRSWMMRACSRLWPALAIALSLFAAPLHAQFAYVANFGSDTVSAYSIGAHGALTPVPGSPFAAGSLPDSVAVDPTGKFAYVVNADDGTVSAYSIGANGALKAVPGSPFAAGIEPFSIAITPLVPFASSFAKLEISAEGFELEESFTLGRNSNGINPVTQNVTLKIGTFSVTIPPGSFKKNPNGRFAFEGTINGVSLEVQIVPLGNNIFTFKAEGEGVDLTRLTNPVTVVLRIGIDSGTTKVTAEF